MAVLGSLTPVMASCMGRAKTWWPTPGAGGTGTPPGRAAMAMPMPEVSIAAVAAARAVLPALVVCLARVVLIRVLLVVGGFAARLGGGPLENLRGWSYDRALRLLSVGDDTPHGARVRG